MPNLIAYSSLSKHHFGVYPDWKVLYNTFWFIRRNFAEVHHSKHMLWSQFCTTDYSLEIGEWKSSHFFTSPKRRKLHVMSKKINIKPPRFPNTPTFNFHRNTLSMGRLLRTPPAIRPYLPPNPTQPACWNNVAVLGPGCQMLFGMS